MRRIATSGQIVRVVLALGLGAAGGCAPYFHQPMKTDPARLGAEVRASQTLVALPEAREKTVVAVYKFRDQTGQYKPTANGSSFSTAISQGTTTILMRALEESKWFNPIERENLGNLLNERKIIRSTRAEYTEQTGQRQPNLPPLLFAGVILEGGIISYDANMLTGGAGLRYFGTGGSGQYRQDRVTVYLRAISTSTGQVLKTVYTSKSILSQQVDASMFRYVLFKRLLETETGFTYNEPSEMAVKEAIEKSVQALVLEGIQDGLWTPRNPADRTGAAVLAYQQEKQENLNIDVLNRPLVPRRGALGLGAAATTQRYGGDYDNSLFRPGVELVARYEGAPGRRMAAQLTVGRSQLAAGRFYRETFNYTELTGIWRLFPYDRVTPYGVLGGGVTTRNTLDFTASNSLLPHVTAGLGVEYLLTDKMGLYGQINYRYFFSDQLDQVTQGKYNDFYWTGQVGLVFYLGGRMESKSLTGQGPVPEVVLPPAGSPK